MRVGQNDALQMLAGEGGAGMALRGLAPELVNYTVCALPDGSRGGQELNAKGDKQPEPAYPAGSQTPNCAAGSIDEFECAGTGGHGYGEEGLVGAGYRERLFALP